jgi:hypothetical protein
MYRAFIEDSSQGNYLLAVFISLLILLFWNIGSTIETKHEVRTPKSAPISKDRLRIEKYYEEGEHFRPYWPQPRKLVNP